MRSPESPIIDFYPTEFGLDMNGKRYTWQAVVLLPFIDEQRLLAAVEPLDDQLTAEEKERNKRGPALLIVHEAHPVSQALAALYPDEDAQVRACFLVGMVVVGVGFGPSLFF